MSEQKMRQAIQQAIDIILTEKPLHEAVVVLRSALGQDVFGDPKRKTFPASAVGFTLKTEPEPVTAPKPFGPLYFD